MTSATVVLLVALILVPQLGVEERAEPWWVRLLAPTIVVIAFSVTALFCVRGFTVRGRELLIQRLLWETRVSLQDLKAAHADPTAMNRSWRTMGNGGLLVFAGWFRNKKLGKYRALVTDQARCVVMEFKDRKLVVSPDDPEGFVKALGLDLEPNRSER